jgi:hypothetical protein
MYLLVALGQGGINSPRGSYVKGGIEPGLEWVGPAGPGLFRPGSAPVSSRLASRTIAYLCALACGPLTSFPSRLRLESCIQASLFPG